jgi:hypothetical protein
MQHHKIKTILLKYDLEFDGLDNLIKITLIDKTRCTYGLR